MQFLIHTETKGKRKTTAASPRATCEYLFYKTDKASSTVDVGKNT